MNLRMSQEAFFKRIATVSLLSFPKLMVSKLRKCSQRLLEHKHERMDLSIFKPPHMWDKVKEADKPFLHYWYGKIEKNKPPSSFFRLKFFMTKSCLKDIFIPGNVFENVVLGYDRSHKLSKSERFCILPFSVLFMVVSNSVLLVVFILGWMSCGLLWPKTLKRYLFTISTEKITPKKKSKEMNEMRVEIKNMREEMRNQQRKVTQEMRNNMLEMRNQQRKVTQE